MKTEQRRIKKELFSISDQEFYADGCFAGVLINPVLPVTIRNQDFYSNDKKTLCRWSDRPFIETLETLQYRVSCLTISSYNGPSVRCHFYTLLEASAYANALRASILSHVL